MYYILILTFVNALKARGKALQKLDVFEILFFTITSTTVPQEHKYNIMQERI